MEGDLLSDLALQPGLQGLWNFWFEPPIQFRVWKPYVHDPGMVSTVVLPELWLSKVLSVQAVSLAVAGNLGGMLCIMDEVILDFSSLKMSFICLFAHIKIFKKPWAGWKCSWSMYLVSHADPLLALGSAGMCRSTVLSSWVVLLTQVSESTNLTPSLCWALPWTGPMGVKCIFYRSQSRS